VGHGRPLPLDAEEPRQLAETIAALEVETQAVVLRAFTVYFHLANIAEQHHRVRRRRDVEREGSTLRESLDEALELLAAEGVTPDEVAVAADRVSVELVLIRPRRCRGRSSRSIA
jgi:phosphoenolpyruvate carboxylase